MEPKLKKLGKDGFWFDHPCSVCGKQASFGVGVSLLAAFRKKDKRHLGVWFCGQHHPDRQQKQGDLF